MHNMTAGKGNSTVVTYREIKSTRQLTGLIHPIVAAMGRSARRKVPYLISHDINCTIVEKIVKKLRLGTGNLDWLN